MKINNKNIDHVDFKHIKSTVGEEADYDEIFGKAIAYDDKNEKEIVVGNIEAYFLNVEDITDSVHYLLDSISSDHESLALYFDDQNKINKKIRKLLKLSDEEVEMSSSNFLYFHKLRVSKKYRGLDIGKTLMHSTIHDYKRDSSFAFLKAAPLQFSKREIENDLSVKEDFKNRTKTQSIEKLIKLYETYGFKEIPEGKGDMVAYLKDWFI